MRTAFLPFLLVAIFILPATITAQEATLPPLSERLSNHVHILAADSLEGRSLGSKGKQKATDYITRYFETFGLKSLSGKGFHQNMFIRLNETTNVDATNIVGYLEGSHPVLRNEYIVIGAHYDHVGFEPSSDGNHVIYNGADDNASGTAMLIELARYFSENRDRIGRSIIFIAFDAEESGLLGSMEFVQNPFDLDLSDIKLMFSLDMVGMYGVYNGLDMKGVGTLQNGSDIARKVASEHGIRLKNTSAKIESRTDTFPFAEVGIPAIHIFTGTVSPYHKPEDTADLLDYEGMVTVTGFMQDYVSALSNERHLEPTRKFTSSLGRWGRSYNYGFTGMIGSSAHAYPDAFFDSGESILSFGGGLFAQMHLGKNLTIQPGVLYDFNGSKTENGRFRRHSVTVPVDLRFNFVNEYGGTIKTYLFGGGYFRHSFAGKVGGTSLDFQNVYREQEWGYSTGIGMDVMNYQITWTVRRAIDTVGRTGVNSFATSSLLTVGYIF